MIAASVVDLPDPVVPVSRISPRSSLAISSIAWGRPSSWIVRTVNGITRATIDTDPRWRNALTRNRARPSTVYEKSISLSLSNAAILSEWSASICRRTRSVSAGASGSRYCSSGSSWPRNRAIGRAGTFR